MMNKSIESLTNQLVFNVLSGQKVEYEKSEDYGESHFIRWRVGDWDCSLDIDGEDFSAHYHSWNVKTDECDERDISNIFDVSDWSFMLGAKQWENQK